MTSVVPAPLITVPAAGFWLFVIAPGAEQLSVTTRDDRKLGTVAWQPASRLIVGSAGAMITGSVTSTTVTSIFEKELFPASSVAVTVTTVIPDPIIVPATGACVMIIFPGIEQLSVAVAFITGTEA